MQRSVQRSDGCSRCRIRIDVRAAHSADRVGGTILLVIGVENKQNIQSVLESGIHPVAHLRRAKKHVQEITRIAQLIVRVDKRHPQRMAIRERRNGGHLSDKAKRLFLSRFDVKDVFRVVIVSRKRRDRGDHHAHRMGIVVKSVEKLLDAFVDERVMRDVVRPDFQLLRGG